MELTVQPFLNGIEIPANEGYLEEIKDLITHPTVQSMRLYGQHGNTDCLNHCLAVSYLSYVTCLRLGLNARAAARGGLLHDMFLYDWHTYRKTTGKRFHGFTHPATALENARQLFTLTKVEEEIILKHMWPITVIPPLYPETYVIVYYDKICSVRETFFRPFF